MEDGRQVGARSGGGAEIFAVVEKSIKSHDLGGMFCYAQWVISTVGQKCRNNILRGEFRQLHTITLPCLLPTICMVPKNFKNGLSSFMKMLVCVFMPC